ncbi:MAG: hypothetical protein KAY37_16130 [Phycisphaerae bacterium]|nr:hypothetical protein [Phycisphaerae bacterium]
MQQKPIRYCLHMKERLVLRQIDQHLPEQIIREADRIVEDAATGYQIALATVTYRGSDHLMMVAFEEGPDEIVAITIHPLDERDVTLKLQSGRWKP